MAIGLENNPNNSAITVAYPYGGIKDNTGAGDGTPINKLTNDDIHQTLRKILALAAITPNGLPDNVTNGFQYITGLNRLFKKFTGVFNDPTNPMFSLTAAHVDKLINIAGNTDTKIFNLPNSNTLQDGDTFTFYNNSEYIGIVQSVTDFVNGDVDITLIKEGDYCELVLDKANFNWVPTQIKSTPIPYVTPIIIVGSGGSAPAYQNSWVQNQPVKFRLNEDGMVTLEGTAQKTGNGTGIIFTLPVGFRPPSNRYFVCAVGTPGSVDFNMLFITTTGTVEINLPPSSDTFLYLNGISFYTN